MAEQDEDSVNLALLAHDLRTPLGAMRLTGELIGKGSLDDAQKEQLSILIRSIDALEQMTTELVAAAHPSAQSVDVLTSIASIVSDSAELFRISAETKGLTYTVSMDQGIEGAMTMHSASLRRIIVCLLDNAIKYTPAGEVSVLATIDTLGEDRDSNSAEPHVKIIIQDTGPGIDSDERARLFRPFVRGRSGRETGPGTGLGLWGTAQLVRKIGGRLVLSQPSSGGSRFEVQLSLEENDQQSVGDQSASVDVASGDLPAHVLIVDDNDTNCRLLAALLESFGISSDVASSGEQAIGLVQKGGYDAVLLDLHMPGMSGVETAETLRASHSSLELPLIAVTAALESITDDHLKDAGFQDVLTKPLSPETLFDVLIKTQAQKVSSQK
ncbi:MAG: response regulator [Roseibium sp.]